MRVRFRLRTGAADQGTGTTAAAGCRVGSTHLRALITNWRAERVPERRGYLLAHAKDDWTNVEPSLAVSLADVVAQLRAGPAEVDPDEDSASVWS